MSAHTDSKYDEEFRLPTFEESLTEERLLKERAQLMEATKQLARLQLEMETRVRMEMEARIQAEMEARMAGEVARMEEERKAREVARELEEMKEKLHRALVEEFSTKRDRYSASVIYRRYLSAIQSYRALYAQEWYTQNNTGYVYQGLVMITDSFVGWTLNKVISGDIVEGEISLIPLYKFEGPLTKRDMRLLEQITWEYMSSICGYFRTIKSNNPSTDTLVMNRLHDFQSAIQLIPGGYVNGGWVPLNGMFGPYWNEEKCLFSKFPPPLDE